MELFGFIQPGGLHGDENRNKSGILFACLTQNGQVELLIVIDGKFLQIRIGLAALVVAVDLGRVVAGTDAGAAHIQRHGIGREQIVHHGRSLCIAQPAEHVRRGLSDGRAEAENLLTRCGRIELNRVCGDLAGAASTPGSADLHGADRGMYPTPSPRLMEQQSRPHRQEPCAAMASAAAVAVAVFRKSRRDPYFISGSFAKTIVCPRNDTHTKTSQ